MFEIIGKIIIYGGGSLLAIAVVFFAWLGFVIFINWK